jgi:hypothetical protein
MKRLIALLGVILCLAACEGLPIIAAAVSLIGRLLR